MTQYFDDDGFKQELARAGIPPEQARDALWDPSWAKLFARWADDNEIGVSQQGMALFLMDYASGTPFERIRSIYLDPDVFQIDWPEGLKTQVTLAQQGMIQGDAVKDQMYNIATEELQAHWPRFREQVLAVAELGAPELQDTSAANIDRAVVDGINQKNLKDLGLGAYLYFWQKDGVILLGDGHPASYYEWAGGYETGYRGTVQMDKKGGLFDTGKVFVAGSPDEDAFDAALRRFSKKQVVHGPYTEEEEVDDD